MKVNPLTRGQLYGVKMDSCIRLRTLGLDTRHPPAASSQRPPRDSGKQTLDQHQVRTTTALPKSHN